MIGVRVVLEPDSISLADSHAWETRTAGPMSAPCGRRVKLGLQSLLRVHTTGKGR